MTVLILGETDDPHVERVTKYLNDYIILDRETIANDVTVTNDLVETAVRVEGEPLHNIHSVYWRDIDFDSFGPFDQEFANTAAHMQLFFNAFPDARWCNPWSAFVEHQTKIKQYERITCLKPATLITSDYDEAYEFFSEFPAVAVKPVAGGQYTKKIKKKKKLSKIKLPYPMCFQEYIEGMNVRTFVIGKQVFAAEIISDDVDFRTGEFVYKPFYLDAERHQQCIDITKTLGYEWTAIDWILREGNWYFLEANFSPMFGYFEDSTNFPIAESLANLLIQ